MPQTMRITFVPRLIAGLSILAFVVLAAWNVSLPGLFFDEVIQNTSAYAFVHGAYPGQGVILHAGGPIPHIGSHAMQLMTVAYLGDVKNVAFIPVAGLFDFSAESVRYFSIAIGALGMAATYAFGRRLFEDRLIPAVGLAILAVDPSWVFFSRVDFGPTVFMVLLKAFGGWMLLRWWETDRTLTLAVGALALGVGVYDKLNFAWILIAAAIALAAVAGRAVWQRLSVRTVLVAGGAFLVGCSPLVVYNLRTGAATLNGLDQGHQTLSGGYLSNVVDRLGVLGDLLDGKAVGDLLRVSFSPHFVELSLLAAVAVVAVCAQLVFTRPLTRELKAGAFLVLTSAILLLLAATAGSINPLGFNGHHVMLVYPAPHLIMGLAVVQAGREFARRAPEGRKTRVFATATGLLAAIPIALALISTVGMLRALDRTGGHGVWSDSVYSMERFLVDKHGKQPVVPLDYGFTGNVVGLSQGKLVFTDLTFNLNTFKDPRKAIAKPLKDPRTWYILNSKPTTVYPRARRRFFEVVSGDHKRAVLVRRFHSRDGQPTFEIYRVAG